MRGVFLIAFIALGFVACGNSASERPARKTKPKNDMNSDATPKPDEPSKPEQPTKPDLLPDNALHPKLLFHGGGGMSTDSLIDMHSAATVLIKLGVPKEHIYLIKYPHQKNIADIKAAVDTQLKTIFAKYPSDTKFDSIGHSLGLLASFVSLAELGYLPKIRSLIGVAGVAMRQDEAKLPMGCKKGSTTDLCGDIFDKVVGSSDSPYILDLISKNSADMQRINKCAVWSKKDGVLSPPNAGVFPGGKSVEMPASWCPMGSILNPCHLQAKSSQAVYEAMKTQCFGGDFK